MLGAWLPGATLALTLIAAGAQAQERPARTLVLTSSGPPEEQAALEASLQELLQRLHVTLSRVEVSDAWLRARVELTAQESALTLTDDGGAVVLFRRLLPRSTRALTLEAVAHVLQGSVEELLRPREPLVAPPSAEGPPPSPAPREAPCGLGFSLGAFAGPRAFGGGAPVVLTVGLGAELAYRRARLTPGVWLSFAYNAPFEAEGTVVTLRAQSLSLRLLPTLRLLSLPSLSLTLGLGGGAEVYFSQARSADLPPNLLAQSRADAAPVLTAMLSAHLALAPRLSLSLSLSGDLDLQPRRYVAELPVGREVLFLPWRVRPTLTAGLTFDLAGAPVHTGVQESSP